MGVRTRVHMQLYHISQAIASEGLCQSQSKSGHDATAYSETSHSEHLFIVNTFSWSHFPHTLYHWRNSLICLG